MPKTAHHIDDDLPLSQLRLARLPTVADQVFDAVHANILSLALPPNTKLSEVEVAKKMGVSRQPVREAFQRLAKLGFLVIKPQSGTTVSLISEEAVLRALYIRDALEKQTCRTACTKLDADGREVLSDLIAQQRDAITRQDRDGFHALDDAFHREICIQAGVDYVWDMIHECKGHMDRIRMLTLTTASQQHALDGHIDIYDAIIAGDADRADALISEHLSRILIAIEKTKTENHHWFTDTSL